MYSLTFQFKPWCYLNDITGAVIRLLLNKQRHGECSRCSTYSTLQSLRCVFTALLFSGVYFTALSVPAALHLMASWLMNDEFEEVLKEALLVYPRHNPRNCLQGLRNTTKNLSCGSLYPGRNLNREPLEYKYQLWRCTALVGNVTTMHMFTRVASSRYNS